MVSSNETVKANIRAAFAAKDAQAFSAWVLILLDRGYAARLGKRGGLSFEFVGVGTGITPEARKSIARQFAAHFGKE